MTQRQTMTRDIGFAIRDFCDSATISHVDEDGEEHHGADEINGIDTPTRTIQSFIWKAASCSRCG